ncbi:MAG: M1 family aminopeptidase [Gemmatimonadales bacterium]
MEAKHAWMDEGFVSYWDELSSAKFWNDAAPRWGTNRFYLSLAGKEDEVPIMQHTDLVSPYGARTLAAYTKPAVVLGALRSVIGDSVFLAAFREYFSSWQLKHPQPWDFFNTVERHAEADLDWFWRPLMFETDVLDQGIVSVTPGANTTTIVVEDKGYVVLPTPVLITFSDGS